MDSAVCLTNEANVELFIRHPGHISFFDDLSVHIYDMDWSLCNSSDNSIEREAFLQSSFVLDLGCGPYTKLVDSVRTMTPNSCSIHELRHFLPLLVAPN